MGLTTVNLYDRKRVKRVKAAIDERASDIRYKVNITTVKGTFTIGFDAFIGFPCTVCRISSAYGK